MEADELAGADLAVQFPPHIELAVDALTSAIASAYPDIVMETLNAAVMALESGPQGPTDPEVARVSLPVRRPAFSSVVSSLLPLE